MRRQSRIILGLNSGTSADGVDAVACEIAGRGLDMRVCVLGRVKTAYTPELRRRLLAVMAPAATRTEEICKLETAVGRAFAAAAAAAAQKMGLRRLDLIGSHGQTICHLPPCKPGRPRPGPAPRRGTLRLDTAAGTLQIGDPAIIAARMRAPVVSRFRQADMAVGGQGAPLVPWTDYVLFRHPRLNRVVHNIGGIANLTWLPAGGADDDVLGFDTGPGNMAIDALVRRFTGGREQFDRGGSRAARGGIHPIILRRLLDHPFLTRQPPKSCGREQFGQKWVREVLKRQARRRLKPDDWIATATALTAVSMTLAYAMFLAPRCGRYPPMDEIILCGGGARNSTLVQQLTGCVSFDGRFNGVRISRTDDYGISTQAKEGVSFAMLAAACIDGVPANLPRVTGATRRVVLGQVCNPEPRV